MSKKIVKELINCAQKVILDYMKSKIKSDGSWIWKTVGVVGKKPKFYENIKVISGLQNWYNILKMILFTVLCFMGPSINLLNLSVDSKMKPF